MEAAGRDTENAYSALWKKDPNSVVFPLPPGVLPCKQVLLVKWQPDNDEVKLKQSIDDLISIVVQHAISHNFTSIAFPAIGCGQNGCSLNIVVKTMVQEVKKHFTQRHLTWTVKFVVEFNHENVYNEFCRQTLNTQDGKLKVFLFSHTLK